MTGLNLETFLHLLRADLGAWSLLGAVICVLVLMTWTSWGSRRALRKCLVLSVSAHVGLALYGSTFLILLLALQPRGAEEETPRARIRQIRVSPWEEEEEDPSNRGRGDGRSGTRVMPWDRPRETLALADPKVEPPRPQTPGPEALAPVEPPTAPTLAPGAAAPELKPVAAIDPESRPEPAEPAEPTQPPTQATPGDPNEVAAPVVVPRAVAEPDADADPSPRAGSDERIRPDRSAVPVSQSDQARTSPEPGPPIVLPPTLTPPGETATAIEGPSPMSSRPAASATASSVLVNPGATEPVDPGSAPEVVKQPEAALPPESALPEAELRQRSRPQRATAAEAAPAAPRPTTEPSGPIALSRVIPGGLPRLPEVQGTTGGRPLTDVPEVYRSRLDPNRSVLAQQAGASPASEQAVERALDWLARHQDTDGRWDGATAKYDDGSPVKGDDDFTVHCPPGETCFGECIYWEADTALTGLALLAYLGSGYTQADGKYAETVGKGIDFLLLQQKPDGDLRGRSRAVGMYCHAMATVALCEAYALAGDERLRDPVERAISFLVNSRSRDGLAWRYAPGALAGDTSILGWVVMALKSAKVVGIPVSASVRNGTLTWLNKVSSGPEHGLARYQPHEPVTPTMTAEAWVCRQFLSAGGPGPASTEAADYLLAHGPSRDPYNLYYWYYGTLAMYQHGGDAWTRWNAEIRDQVVRRQQVSGHKAGSWDPDDSLYGAKGGRIYCTALATLTLEVYYRYLRLYDDPKLPTSAAPATTPRRSDDPTTAIRPRTGRTP